MHGVRREGDLVTITNKEDLEKAMAESLVQAERLQASHGQQGRFNAQAMLPPMRFSLQKVASEVRSLLCCSGSLLSGFQTLSHHSLT